MPCVLADADHAPRTRRGGQLAPGAPAFTGATLAEIPERGIRTSPFPETMASVLDARGRCSYLDDRYGRESGL